MSTGSGLPLQEGHVSGGEDREVRARDALPRESHIDWSHPQVLRL